MNQILAANWVYMHYGLIVSIICAQVLVVYVLNNSTHPPAGLGGYTVYFVAAALCAIAITVQWSSGVVASIDLAAIATFVTCYILFFATGQRAGIAHGRVVFAAICLLAFLSGFFLQGGPMFLVESVVVSLFSLGIGILSFIRARRESSLGDAMIGCATLVTLIGMLVANYHVSTGSDLVLGHAIIYGVYSSAYALIVMGFFISVFSEYQHHLQLLAVEDPLTGLFNRRGMAEALHVSLASAARQGLPTSAIMVDIDHFQKIIDNFGQETGDRVIQQTADILNRMARASDVIARTGGEEYLLVLPDTPLDSARILADRIRSTMDDNPLLIHRQSIHITVSIGVTCVEGQASIDELSQSAEKAVYLAKRGGRNKVASVEHRPVQLTTLHTGA